jgi:single-strand DNA-binding protein
MNKVILVGRLTADPELRKTQSGIASCKFTVAVNRRFKNERTGEYDADFITCQAWRQTAEFVSRYFSKGKMILIEGSLRTGKYQDKNHSDVTHYTTDVFVDNVEFVGGKNDSGQAKQSQVQTTAQGVQAEHGDLSEFEEILSDDSDLPF